MRVALVVLMMLSLVGGLVSTFAEEADVAQYMFRGTRPMALGNAFEAIADDTNALHYNPAGIAQDIGSSFELLLARPRVTYDLAQERSELRDLIDAVEDLSNSDDPLNDPDPSVTEGRELIVDALERLMDEDLGIAADLPSLNLAFPVTQIGDVRLALGLATYTQFNTSVDIVPRGLPWSDPIKAVLDDQVVYTSAAQWGIAGSIAGGLPPDLPFLSEAYGGLTIRYLSRYTMTDVGDPFTVEDILEDPDGFQDDYFVIEDGMSVVDFLDENADHQTGVAMDFGLIVKPIEGLKVGMAIRNLVGTLTTEDTEEEARLARNVALSAAVKPFDLLGMDNGILDLTVAVGIDDPNGDDALTQFTTNSLDKFHLGIEAVLWPDAPLSLAGRLGSNQGFATFGLGLNLGPVALDFARYGDLQADWYVGSLGFGF